MFRRPPIPLQRTSRSARVFAVVAISLAHVAILVLLNAQSPRNGFSVSEPDIRSIITLRLIPFDVLPSLEKLGGAKHLYPLGVVRNQSDGRAAKAVAEDSSPTPLQLEWPHAEVGQAPSIEKIATPSTALDLALPKGYLAQERAKHSLIPDERILSGAKNEAEKFSKAFGTIAEYREVRLSEDRVRVHTRYGCFELYRPSGAKHTDPFGRSPEYVSRCSD